MKTFYKIMIPFCIGICLIFGGVSLGGLSQVHTLGFLDNFELKWGYDPIDDIHFESNGNIERLHIEVSKANVQIHESLGSQNIQIIAKNLHSGFDVYQKSEKIVIDQPHYWGVSQPDNAQIDIYIPRDMVLDKIDINMSAGKTKIENLKAKKVDIDTAAGDLSVNHIECHDFDLDASMGKTTIKYLDAQKIDVDSGMGDVKMLLKGHENDYNYNITVGLGKVSVGSESFSGIVKHGAYDSDESIRKLDVDCGLGNIDIEMEDLL